MKKYLAILSLLLPSLLWAGTFTVKKAEKAPHPAGWVKRMSLMTANSVEYQDTASFNRGDFKGGSRQVFIGSVPIAYQDSLGVWHEYNFDTAQDTVSGFQVVRTGKFDVAYDSTGRIRWQKKDALLMISPAFSRTNVDIDFYIHRNGLKANYILKNASAPNVLKWLVTANDTVEEQAGGKGKGNLKKASKIMGQISAFTAKDAAGKVVNLSATYKKDSLIVTLDTAGAVFPVTVDPSVQDTILNAASGSLGWTDATFLTARNTVTSEAANAFASMDNAFVTSAFVSGFIYYVYRIALSFPLTDQIAVTVVDSARLFVNQLAAGHPATSNGIIAIAKGTFTSAAIAVGWYNDFTGWAASGAYTPTEWSDRWTFVVGASGWKSQLFNAAGNTAIKTAMNTDTLRIMLLHERDIAGSTPTDAQAVVDLVKTSPPYLLIYYRLNPPGVTTVSDTAKASAILYATIDSVGTSNATERGFKIWKSGGTAAADTITLTKSGSFAAGAFRDSTKGLFSDTVYLYKGFATNPAGTSYGAIDSFTATAGGRFYYDGRLVTGIH